MPATAEYFDVLIVGAGLSGIGAACRLAMKCPGKSLAILEARAASGGTWDLFRYPGVRSDSDMYTLGYAFRPWRKEQAIAGGKAILDYIRNTAAAAGIDGKIRYGCRVVEASWSCERGQWTVTVIHDGAKIQFTCAFLWWCSGYYSYERGYLPAFKDSDRFKGRFVHPQFWPETLDYEGQRVVVIGSGATAVTLIPAMAGKTRHITMLQRSPTYMFSMPAVAPLAKTLKRYLPASIAYRAVRWHKILFQSFTYWLITKTPHKSKKKLIKLVREKLPGEYDVDTHFTPNYPPWEQRLCLVPDDDLFDAISAGRASVVTDEIEAFVENGVRLKSGKMLEADIIVTATGLALQLLGGARLVVDGEPVDLGKQLTYKGVMVSGLPNMASTFGYLNASWTLRADLVSEYVCRLINFMDRKGAGVATPVLREKPQKTDIFADFSSGYIARAADILPKQGPRAPWRQPQNYLLEIWRLRFAPVGDEALHFTSAASGDQRRQHDENVVAPA